MLAAIAVPVPVATATAIVGAAATAALYGHAAMVDPRRRLSAGPTVRRTVARATVVAVGVAIAVSFHAELADPRLDTWTLGVAVLDRTQIILRVFQERAQTREAELEIERRAGVGFRFTFEGRAVTDDAA